MKFPGILLDENLSWKEHLKLTENNIPKNIALINKAQPYLIKDSLLAIYFSYIHSYINYANLEWGRTRRTYFQKISSQQKHTLRLIHNRKRFHHSKEIFESCEILNLYKLDLLNTAAFMHKIKNRTALLICIQHASQVGIRENRKLNYTKEDFKFLSETQWYGTTLMYGKRNFVYSFIFTV